MVYVAPTCKHNGPLELYKCKGNHIYHELDAFSPFRGTKYALSWEEPHQDQRDPPLRETTSIICLCP